MSASASDVAGSRSRPSASGSRGFVQSTGATVFVRFVSPVSALRVTGAQDIATSERIQNVDDDVKFQSDKGAIVVVNAMR